MRADSARDGSTHAPSLSDTRAHASPHPVVIERHSAQQQAQSTRDSSNHVMSHEESANEMPGSAHAAPCVVRHQPPAPVRAWEEEEEAGLRQRGKDEIGVCWSERQI